MHRSDSPDERPDGPVALRAVTYLGANTVPMLDGVCRHLDSTIPRQVVHDTLEERSSRHAIAGARAADLVWACGKLTVELIAAGDLDAVIVAAPVFANEAGPVYRSVFIARAHGGPTDLDLALEGRVAVNEIESWSGHHGLRRHLAARAGVEPGREPWFAATVLTGSHHGSATAVRDGTADVAGLDHTVWDDLIRNHPSAVEGLTVIAHTDDWPAPPFSLPRAWAPELRRELVAALVSLAPGQAPGLDGIVPADDATYEIMKGP